MPAFQVLQSILKKADRDTRRTSGAGTYSQDALLFLLMTKKSTSFLYHQPDDNCFLSLFLFSKVSFYWNYQYKRRDWVLIHVWELKCFINSNISLWHNVTNETMWDVGLYIHFCTNGVNKDASLSINYSLLLTRMCIDNIFPKWLCFILRAASLSYFP